jgi:hypothetical protein
LKRKITILGRVRDVEGSLWLVREIRDTKHGSYENGSASAMESACCSGAFGSALRSSSG